MKPYEILEHTADVGLRIHGRHLKELFAHAALGLFDLITDCDRIKKEKEAGPAARTFRLTGEDAGGLLLKWLRELLFTFSTKHFVFWKFNFKKITERELEVAAEGGIFNPSAHEQKYEVKAVTYHQFKIEKTKQGWVAEVILDI